MYTVFLEEKNGASDTLKIANGNVINSFVNSMPPKFGEDYPEIGAHWELA